MKSEEFRALLDLFMCSDPWPIVNDRGAQKAIKSLLDKESREMGFDDLVEAYYLFERRKDEKEND